MKVLVMNCSPVRNGATAEIVNIVTARLEKKHDVKNICIDDYDIKFCKGCRICHNTANIYVFRMTMLLCQTSSNYINNFCCCSISYRTTIHYQYFHFDLRFHVPYFYMISQNHYIINNNRNILRLFPSFSIYKSAV